MSDSADGLEEVPVAADDPELARLKAQHRTAFKAAFEEAVATGMQFLFEFVAEVLSVGEQPGQIGGRVIFKRDAKNFVTEFLTHLGPA